MQYFWFESQDREPEKLPQTAEGLVALANSTDFIPQRTALWVGMEELDIEARVNLVALIHKSLPHVSHILGLNPRPLVMTSHIWRVYRRNCCDMDHNEGVPHPQILSRFVANHLQFMEFGDDAVRFNGRFSHAAMAAAAAGRFVNAIRWCKRYTPAIKLVSEAGLSWSTFEKICLEGEQPIVRRRRA